MVYRRHLTKGAPRSTRCVYRRHLDDFLLRFGFGVKVRFQLRVKVRVRVRVVSMRALVHLLYREEDVRLGLGLGSEFTSCIEKEMSDYG